LAFCDELKSASGVDLSRCTNCRKCSEVCPVVDLVSRDPHRLVKMINSDERDAVLATDTIWLCTACRACSAACGEGIDLARAIDSLRAIAVAEGAAASAMRPARYHELFVREIKGFGRVNHTRLARKHSAREGLLFRNLEKKFVLFQKGRLPLSSRGVGDASAVKRAFDGPEEGR
jgi:heterodisulfide reductase subunit C